MDAPYHYIPRGRNWVVYKWDNERRSTASPVKTYFSKAEASKAVYKLNGWVSSWKTEKVDS